MLWSSSTVHKFTRRFDIKYYRCFPVDTTTLHFSSVRIVLVTHFCNFICAIRPIYTTFQTNLVFNINLCRFSTSRPVFDINTMFGEKRFNSNAMVTSFRNSIWRHPPSSTSIIVLIVDSTDAFYIKFATSPLSLVKIGQTVEALQTFFRISRWRRPPSWHLMTVRFLTIQCVPYQIRNIPTKVSAHCFNSKEMANIFRN